MPQVTLNFGEGGLTKAKLGIGSFYFGQHGLDDALILLAAAERLADLVQVLAPNIWSMYPT
jgi:hypothetical protein